MVEVSPDSVVDRRAALSLSDEDLARLVAPTDVRVEEYASSYDHVAHDQWVVLLDSLGLRHRDIGLDAALIGLARKVGARVAQLLSEPSEEREGLLPLLVKLHLAGKRRLARRLAAELDGPHQVGTPPPGGLSSLSVFRRQRQ